MKITCNWLRDYVEFDWDWRELVDRLTMSGLELEGATDLRARFEGIVVGRVLECGPHPQADRLSVCRVDTGHDVTATIVCGAPNVAAGQLVPVITPGHCLPDGTQIDETTIRGVESAGMICSEVELGLGDDGSGILVLPDAYRVGAAFAEESGMADVVVDFEVTPNRPDCLSLVGIAREVSALNGAELKPPRHPLAESGEPASGAAAIEIDDPNGCPRYVGRLIRGVRVGPSPAWLSNRLLAVGLRPINNIVDATNYVMMELGQPLHAFDLARLHDRRIVVRRARKGESLQTLDGTERELDDDILVIADGRRPVALAGIMGGADSEVTVETTDILLESAFFAPALVRANGAKLGLHTEASVRFERGADWEMPPVASDRAASLIAEIAGGEVAPGRLDAYPTPLQRTTIPLRVSRLQSLLGVQIEAAECHRILISLGCELIEGSDVPGDGGPPGEAPASPKNTADAVFSASAVFSAPSFRPDLQREADLVEEVGRVYGYDNVEESCDFRGPLVQPGLGDDNVHRAMKQRLAGLGFDEVVTNSIVQRDWLGNGDGSAPLVELANPPTENQSALRSSLIPGLLDVARRNFNRRADTVSIFEVGRQFSLRENGEVAEGLSIAGLWAGFRSASPWRSERLRVDYLDLKGVLEVFLEDLEPRFVAGDASYFRPGLCSSILTDTQLLGHGGEAAPDLVDSFDLHHSVYIFELEFDALAQVWGGEAAFKPLPKFPPIERDLAVVVGHGVPAAEVIDAIREVEPELIEVIDLFDVYRGDAIAADRKSLAFSIRLRSSQTTLEDRRADEIMQQVLSRLSSDFGATLREG